MYQRLITYSWYASLFSLRLYTASLIKMFPKVFMISSISWQGDFVDRGYNSLEVFTILLLLKARYIFISWTCGGTMGVKLLSCICFSHISLYLFCSCYPASCYTYCSFSNNKETQKSTTSQILCLEIYISFGRVINFKWSERMQ